jgi:putative aldouronate transport system substrate-binding protein
MEGKKMFNILKKAVLMLLIVCLICQMGACVNKKDRGDTISTDVDLNQGTIISKEPIEFSFFYNASKEPDGEWLVFKEAAKMTNVSVHVTLSKSNSDFNQAFNLMLSSGEMADLVMGY